MKKEDQINILLEAFTRDEIDQMSDGEREVEAERIHEGKIERKMMNYAPESIDPINF